MTADDYVLSVVSQYQLTTGPQSPAYQAAQQLYPIIKNWANEFFLNVSFSGSYAKGTGIKGSTDVDLFISLVSQTPGTLKEIYENLYAYLAQKGYAPRRQNVSVGLTYHSLSVDLIPARKQSGNTNDHSLFKNKAQTWTQTNIQTHIDKIQQSGRLNEIRAIKIWRNLNHLDFPSFYLELTVLDALYDKNKNQPATNVLTVLEYLRDDFIGARVVDPANSNNIISDDLTSNEKSTISRAAKNTLTKSRWDQIIW
ncbi:MAG: nucleotidyltransferase [Chlamydiota bacterium]|nr:nucleotidyltransferase [Chlamydiota bacterium]